MIKVEKDFDNIPDILNSSNRKEAFEKNIQDEAFNHGKSLYKPDGLKSRLHNIYNFKCVYCEDSLLNAPKHVEHYRPKDIYYWLAYSWDNLLLCCTSCNSSKGINFETANSKVEYNQESFDNIHSLGSTYDGLEKPKLVNPERDDILQEIVFNKDAEISSENDRIDYTITTCNLNRGELIKLRIEILNDFVQLVNDYYLQLDADKNVDKTSLIKSFIPLVRKFIEDCNKEKKFYSFRYFIINNIDVFFANDKIVKIINHLITNIK